MVLYPIPEAALMGSLNAWLASRTEDFLSDWTATTVWPIAEQLPDRLIVVAPGNAGDRQVVDLGMLAITVLGPVGDYDTTLQAAQYLKAALPSLTGNGIAALTRVTGPTAASDASGRPKRILTADFVTTAARI
jgi:hypothetical protein